MRVLMTLAVLGACMVAPGTAYTDPTFVEATAAASPAVAQPGGKVHFGLDCGGPAGSGWLTGISLGLPREIRMRRDGPQRFALSVTVPASTRPGRYHVDMQCANGESALTVFDVVDVPHATGAVSPRVGHRGQP